jgi:hypothetical protein
MVMDQPTARYRQASAWRLMDSYGITPKGQQDRRWLRPEPPEPPNKLHRYLGRDHCDQPRVARPSAKEHSRELLAGITDRRS